MSPLESFLNYFEGFTLPVGDFFRRRRKACGVGARAGETLKNSCQRSSLMCPISLMIRSLSKVEACTEGEGLRKVGRGVHERHGVNRVEPESYRRSEGKTRTCGESDGVVVDGVRGVGL